MKVYILLAIVFLLSLTSFSASIENTTAEFTKIHKVIIEKDIITILADATTTVIIVTETKYRQRTYRKKPIASVHPKAYKATFIIKRTPLIYNDPQGTHAKEKAKVKKILDDLWEKTVAQAAILQAKKKGFGVSFYQPEITIKRSHVTQMIGPGVLYEIKP